MYSYGYYLDKFQHIQHIKAEKKMTDILQKASSNSFFECMLVQFTLIHHWLRYWLGTEQATGHYLNKM